MRVAALQLDYRPGESRTQRAERVVDLLRCAPAVNLVVLPELWDVGFFDFESYASAGRALEESSVKMVAQFARERNVHVVAGSVLERDDGAMFNTVALVGPDGGVIAKYRKIHLFGYASKERELLSPGTRLVVVTTPIGRIGLATCFDLRFPEQFLGMRELDADVIVVPAAWPELRRKHWEVLTRARALDTQTPIVACNGVGPCYGVELAGESAVLDAEGKPLAVASSNAGWISADINYEATRAWRKEFPLLRSIPATGQ